MVANHPVYGIEEEVFVLEPGRPSVRSLYYLARLLWSDPRRYYTHSASNFSRGRDLWNGLMSGVEISTGKHDSIAGLIQDLAERRQDLAGVSQGLICPIGNLPDSTEATNTSGLHLHISGVDRLLACQRLVRYLPAFALALAHAPYAGGRRFGQSFRWVHSYALGPLRSQITYRFQDLIWSRRLGTIEVRVFDPSPDLSRLAALLECLHRLLTLEAGHTPADGSEEKVAHIRYNQLREQAARLRGETAHRGAAALAEEGTGLDGLVSELGELVGFLPEWIAHTPADATATSLREKGPAATYLALDAGYRQWAGTPGWNGRQVPLVFGAIAGFLGYYFPRLPYTIWKAWKEWS
ncbi:MAG TPA: hypothetical protein GX513_08795 [Firmicutes bacterium]|nr:hypothetical protein [Bacillota bacterium]